MSTLEKPGEKKSATTIIRATPQCGKLLMKNLRMLGKRMFNMFAKKRAPAKPQLGERSLNITAATAGHEGGARKHNAFSHHKARGAENRGGVVGAATLAEIKYSSSSSKVTLSVNEGDEYELNDAVFHQIYG